MTQHWRLPTHRHDVIDLRHGQRLALHLAGHHIVVVGVLQDVQRCRILPNLIVAQRDQVTTGEILEEGGRGRGEGEIVL